MGGITGDGRRCPGVGRLSAPTGHSAPCVGADEIIGPLAGLANGCCFLCYRPLAGLCRAGDLARRMGFAALQGFRDDASIVPPTGLAEGWCLCVAARFRPQCRAGDLARRMRFAALQGFRDDASIVPYGCGAGHCRSLQEAALKGKPSPLPLRAAFCAAALFAGRQFCQVVSGKARRF